MSNQNIHDILENILNCILIEEGIRDGFHPDNYVELNNYIHLFPNLHVIDVEGANGSKWNFITKKKLTKQKIKSLSYHDPNHDESIGKLLGYPCYKEYVLKHKIQYGIHLMVEYKYKNKRHLLQMFANACSTKDHVNVFDTYAKKSNDIIHKYDTLMNTFNVKNIKFYTKITTPNHDIAMHIIYVLINMMLVDSTIIKGIHTFEIGLIDLFKNLLNKYFPNIHTSLQHSTYTNDDILLLSHEIYKNHSIHQDEYETMSQYQNEKNHKYTATLVAYVDTQEFNEIILLDVHSLCKTQSKSKFKKLLHDANSIVERYHNVMKVFQFNISKFDIMFD
jgi:hypothetical protein